MSRIRKEIGLSFNDVLLVPQYSNIKSRKDVDLSTYIGPLKLKIPIISANMDTITGPEMAIKMGKLGGLGILHRYADSDTVLGWIKEIKQENVYAVPSIGIKEHDKNIAMKYMEAGANAICIDIAHGHSESMVEMKNFLSSQGVPCIVGNIASNAAATLFTSYLNNPAAIKIGIGPGSLCTTRVKTGCGFPQLSAIKEVSDAVDGRTSLIADGGIKCSGDIVKALAIGANAVMIGGLFAGCTETPKIKGQRLYRGMASFSAQEDFRGSVNNDTAEGESMAVSNNGSIEDVVKDLLGGIRSGMSYCGANNILELQLKAEFIQITQNGWDESLPHGLKL
jgi:IMP dehydrogenase